MSKWLGLNDKVIVVTGGSSGIGHAVVDALLDVGAKVANLDIQECTRKHENLFFSKTDVTNLENIKSSIDAVIAHFGRIDGLVNNAGINIPCLLVDSNEQNSKYEIGPNNYTRMTDINLKGVVFVAQAVARHLVAQKSGVIINMSSESGIEGSEGQSIYAATKAALNSLTRSWAKELAKFNIRVIGIAPGILEVTGLRTESYEQALAYTRNKTVQQLRDGYNNTSSIPMGRSGKLSEVADTVCYYLSDRASYITGVTTNVSGGKTRG